MVLNTHDKHHHVMVHHPHLTTQNLQLHRNTNPHTKQLKGASLQGPTVACGGSCVPFLLCCFGHLRVSLIDTPDPAKIRKLA